VGRGAREELGGHGDGMSGAVRAVIADQDGGGIICHGDLSSSRLQRGFSLDPTAENG
jgi:hypothetical protein